MLMVLLAASLCYAEPPKWLDEKTVGIEVLGFVDGKKGLERTNVPAPKGQGIFVERILPHSQAEGDIWFQELITQANKKSIRTEEDWQKLIEETPVGELVRMNVVTLLNDGKGGSSWGKATKVNLVVSTKREAARMAVTITTDAVSGSKNARLKDGSKIAVGDGPLRMSFGVGADGKATQPMLVIFHIGKDWIFMDSVSVRAGDTLKTISLKDATHSREAVGGSVIEVCAVPMSGIVREAAELMTKGKTIVRLSGTKPHVDHAITPEQKDAMRSMLAAFVAYDGEWPE